MISKISRTRPFLDILAESLLARKEQLVDDIVFLPSNRACLGLRQILMEKIEGSLLLPKIKTFTPESDENIITDEERLILMTRLLMGRGERPEKAIGLARTLLALLDETEERNVDIGSLEGHIREDLTLYFKETVEFLKIITNVWPDILKERGRKSTITALKEWVKNWTPEKTGKIIAAGFQTSEPTLLTALKKIAEAPNGEVILPDGFETSEITETHPGFETKQMLIALKGKETKVEIPEYFPQYKPADQTRERIVAEIMRPAETTSEWQNVNIDTAKIKTMTLKDENEEAKTIALMLKQVLETPDQTAIVVSTDKYLNRKIVSEMRRFDVVLNDSNGIPLSHTKTGIFLNLIAELAHDSTRPDLYLAMVKHPLYTNGKSQKDARNNAREIESQIRNHELKTFSLPETFFGLRNRKSVPFEKLFMDHLEIAGQLASSDDKSGEERLYGNEEGAIVKEELEKLAPYIAEIGNIDPFDYAATFSRLIADKTARTVYSGHPRLRLLGAIEAHLEKADVMIVADMNEGNFPKETMKDPFLNRNMCKHLGLRLPEEAIGREAHNLCCFLGNPEIILTRSLKKEGKSQNASRWILRLNALDPNRKDETDIKNWAEALDNAKEEPRMIGPEPSPGPSWFPKKISLTDVELLIKDPYAIYAKYILKLFPKDMLRPDTVRQDYGSAVHKAIEIHLKRHGDLKKIGHEEFQRNGISYFWESKFDRMAEWFVAQNLMGAKAEVAIEKEIAGVTIKGRADAIKDKVLIDFKTGGIPKPSEVVEGIAPQLPLLGYLLGGIEHFEYWHLTGKEEGGEIIRTEDKDKNKTSKEIMQDIGDNVTRLFHHYKSPKAVYRARPRNAFAPKYSKYDHLSRWKEWGKE